MRRSEKLVVLMLTGLLLLAGRSMAQPLPPDDITPSEPSASANWLGISILGHPALRFSSVQDYVSGVTLDHATLELSLAQTLQWSLQVRATGDLLNGSQSIPISTISIQPLNMAGSTATITLSTASQTLVTGQLTRLQVLSPTFRYRTQGGKAFLKPGGTYSTTLIFTYTAL